MSIDYHTYLMPVDKGMKLVELLQSAVECDRDFAAGGHIYTVRSQPNVELAFVKPHQVRAAAAPAGDEPAAPRRLIGRS